MIYLRGLAVAFVSMLWVPMAPDLRAESPPYETPPVLDPREHLPPELLSGPNFVVDEQAFNDGYMNTYTILTPWGRFEAYGEEMLRRRIDEVRALEQLAEIGQPEVFVDSLGDSLRDTWDSTARVVRNPIETLEGVPRGLKRFFVEAGRKIEEGYEDLNELADEVSEELAEHREEKRRAELEEKSTEEPAEEGAEKSSEEQEGESEERSKSTTREILEEVQEEATHQVRNEFGVSRAQRQWARQLGVDPYSDNAVLRRELERVARAEAVGRYARKLVPSVELVGELGRIDEMVWSKDPHELKKFNRRRLFTIGVDETVVDRLLDNRNYSPSRVTGLISALISIDGVFGRYQLARLAAAAISPEEAYFFERGIELLAAYHRERERFDEILTGPIWGGGLTDEGTLVLALPIDHLVWTREVGGLFPLVSARYRGNAEVRSMVLWLSGTVSERARRALEALGWTIETRRRPSRVLVSE